MEMCCLGPKNTATLKAL